MWSSRFWASGADDADGVATVTILVEATQYVSTDLTICASDPTAPDTWTEEHDLLFGSTPPPSYFRWLTVVQTEPEWIADQTTLLGSVAALSEATILIQGTGPEGQVGCLACGPAADGLCPHFGAWIVGDSGAYCE